MCLHRVRSRRFYEGLLGFQLWWELTPPDPGTDRLLQLDPPLGLHATYLVRDGLVLELLDYSAREARAGPQRVMDEVGLTPYRGPYPGLRRSGVVPDYGGSVVSDSVSAGSAMSEIPTETPRIARRRLAGCASPAAIATGRPTPVLEAAPGCLVPICRHRRPRSRRCDPAAFAARSAPPAARAPPRRRARALAKGDVRPAAASVQPKLARAYRIAPHRDWPAPTGVTDACWQEGHPAEGRIAPHAS